MSNAGLGALLSGMSSGYMAGKEMQRLKDDPAPVKKPEATDTSTGTAVQNYADQNPNVVSAPGLGVNGMQQAVGVTGAAAAPATPAAPAATDTGSWNTLAGFLNKPKV